MLNNMKGSNNEINKCVKVLMVEDNINYGRLIKKNLQSLKNEKFELLNKPLDRNQILMSIGTVFDTPSNPLIKH